MIMARPRSFGRKQSIRHAMLPTEQSYFRVFGCKCFIYKKKRLGKFESRCDESFFLGYASNSKAYRVFNQTSGLVEETCDVEFEIGRASCRERVYDDV